MLVSETATRRSLLFLLGIVLSAAMIAAAPARALQNVIKLPDGFQPEGIAAGNGDTFYVGSIPTGEILTGDVRTGAVGTLVPAEEGRAAIGMKYDESTGLLFVAGGPTGKAYVYDAESGDLVAEIQLAEAGSSFINDVVITPDAAYFTNSSAPVIYRVSLADVGPSATFEAIELGGEYQFTEGAFNANGIAATPDGGWLIIVNSAEGALYRVDPMTGFATRIDLHGDSVEFGDGILLQGETLYVVQNQLNQIAVVELNSDFSEGTIVDTLTHRRFDVPTTIARFGNSLYAVNARFGSPPPIHTPDDIVRVPIK
jgi:sugar lactone lactonase YvrE